MAWSGRPRGTAREGVVLGREAGGAAEGRLPSVGDVRQVRVERGPQARDRRRQRVGEVLVLAVAEPVPRHDDARPELARRRRSPAASASHSLAAEQHARGGAAALVQFRPIRSSPSSRCVRSMPASIAGGGAARHSVPCAGFHRLMRSRTARRWRQDAHIRACLPSIAAASSWRPAAIVAGRACTAVPPAVLLGGHRARDREVVYLCIRPAPRDLRRPGACTPPSSPRRRCRAPGTDDGGDEHQQLARLRRQGVEPLRQPIQARRIATWPGRALAGEGQPREVFGDQRLGERRVIVVEVDVDQRVAVRRIRTAARARASR